VRIHDSGLFLPYITCQRNEEKVNPGLSSLLQIDQLEILRHGIITS